MSRLQSLYLLALIALVGCAHTHDTPSPLDAPTRATLNSAGIDHRALRCNSDVSWKPDLWKRSKGAAVQIAALYGGGADKATRRKAARVVLGEFVRLSFELLAPHNLGVIALRGHQGPGGEPMLVYRSGVMTDLTRSGSCLRTLLGAGGVKHVVNLYAGRFPLHSFIEDEAKIARQVGVSHHSEPRAAKSWRELIHDEKHYLANRGAAMEQVAALIHKTILQPQGVAPKGNILLHCGGGMHRTGMVYGVLRRCINGEAMPVIEADYKAHTAYTDAKRVGGYEPLNLRFIADFDCSLLQSKSGGGR